MMKQSIEPISDKPIKKRSVKKTILIFIAGLIVIFLVVGWYSSTHILSNPKYGFQFYQPTQLPSGIHITQKRIDVVNPDGKFLGLNAEMDFRTVNWVYEIQESRAGSANSPSISTVTTKLANYDPTTAGFTCEQQKSPKGQSYRLCHSIDYGKISNFGINFIKDKTYISTNFPESVGKVIPISQINTYVDSFVKARATGFKIIAGGI